MKLLDAMFTVVDADDARVRIQLHADHPIYQAHFPGNPITPGVCLIQIIQELVALRLQRELSLLTVVNLKFAAPVSPVDTPIIDVCLPTVQEDGDRVRVKGSILSYVPSCPPAASSSPAAGSASAGLSGGFVTYTANDATMADVGTATVMTKFSLMFQSKNPIESPVRATPS